MRRNSYKYKGRSDPFLIKGNYLRRQFDSNNNDSSRNSSNSGFMFNNNSFFSPYVFSRNFNHFENNQPRQKEKNFSKRDKPSRNIKRREVFSQNDQAQPKNRKGLGFFVKRRKVT